MTDRRTAITADQIEDNTLTPLEIYTTNTSIVGQSLAIDINGQFYWETFNTKKPKFENDINSDIEATTADDIFTYDGNDDLMPTLDGTYDEEFEINGSDEITPKV